MRKDFAFTVKAIIIKGDRFLVLKRSKKEMEKRVINRLGVWDLPGGSVKFNETAEHGLFREIREETGIKVSLEWILNVYDSIHFNLHMVIITYVCVYKEGQVCLSDEHDEFYWLTIEEMQEMGIPRYMIRDFRYVYDEYH